MNIEDMPFADRAVRRSKRPSGDPVQVHRAGVVSHGAVLKARTFDAGVVGFEALEQVEERLDQSRTSPVR